MSIESVRVLLLLQSYLTYIDFLVPACFWRETLELPIASLLELFRGPPEVQSPLLTYNFKVLLSAPFYIELPFSPIDAPAQRALLLNFLFKVNVKSGDSSRDLLRALDVFVSVASLCTAVTTMNEAALLQKLPDIKQSSSSDAILTILAQTESAFFLFIPAADFHARIPLRALDVCLTRECVGEPFKACLAPSALAEKRKIELICGIKQNCLVLVNPVMVASALIALKPMLLIAQHNSVFGIVLSIHKFLSKVSAAQQQICSGTPTVYYESPFENLSEASLSMNIAHLSAVVQTSEHKSLLLRVTGTTVKISQEPRLEFAIAQITANTSSHPHSQAGGSCEGILTSHIVHTSSEVDAAVSVVLETKKAPKKINKKQFNEAALADTIKWRDGDSRQFFREDSSDFDVPHFSVSIMGSVSGLRLSLNVDELLAINFTAALVNDLILALKLIETHEVVVSQLFNAEVAESSNYYEFADRVRSLSLGPQLLITQDALSLIFDAFKIKRNSKCFFACSICLSDTFSVIQFMVSSVFGAALRFACRSRSAADRPRR
jgi:hypothetical protein